MAIEKLDINICILDLSQYLNFAAWLVTPAEPWTEISITLNAPAGLVTEIYKYHFSKQWLESHQSFAKKPKKLKSNPFPPVTQKIHSEMT